MPSGQRTRQRTRTPANGSGHCACSCCAIAAASLVAVCPLAGGGGVVALPAGVPGPARPEGPNVGTTNTRPRIRASAASVGAHVANAPSNAEATSCQVRCSPAAPCLVPSCWHSWLAKPAHPPRKSACSASSSSSKRQLDRTSVIAAAHAELQRRRSSSSTQVSRSTVDGGGHVKAAPEVELASHETSKSCLLLPRPPPPREMCRLSRHAEFGARNVVTHASSPSSAGGVAAPHIDTPAEACTAATSPAAA